MKDDVDTNERREERKEAYLVVDRLIVATGNYEKALAEFEDAKAEIYQLLHKMFPIRC
jgi:hypothetical protein